MKQSLQALLRRPSTWLSALSAGLLLLVLLAPQLEKKPAGDSAATVKPQIEPTKKSPPSPPPPAKAPEIAVSPLPRPPLAAAPSPAPPPLMVEPAQPAILPPPVARPIEGPPSPAVQAAKWDLVFHGAPLVMGPPRPGELSDLIEAVLAGPPLVTGPPGPAELAGRMEIIRTGPPEPAELTRLALAAVSGPPSPAGMGPPAEWMSDEAKALLAESDSDSHRGEDSEFAHGEEDAEGSPKLAANSLQKPTTRITPPPSAPVPKEPEPPPPPLSEEPLPPAQGDVWKIVKINGREYVTGQSIQLFYRFSTHKVEGKHVWFRNPNLIIKTQLGSQEMLVNNIKFILSYPVLSHDGKALFSRLDLCKLIEPVIRPSYIGAGSLFDTVVLDAGHGGHDVGAKGVYGYEKNYALALVLVTKAALQKRGFKVVLTRGNDTYPSLSSRVALANRTPNSIFISIHFNSGGSAASGIETFALTPQGSASSLARGGGFSNTARNGNEFDSENIALATAVHAQVVSRFKLIDRGIKRARWSVLSSCQRPGILFEGGFVTNARECQLIASDKYRVALAEALGDAVVNYRRALAPAPKPATR